MQSASALLKVVNLPSQSLAYTNAVFVNPADASLIRPTHNDTAFVTINDELVYEIRSETSVEKGAIGLNSLQRSALRLSSADNCQLKSLIIQPKANFNLAFLQVEVCLLKTIRYTLEEDALIDFIQRRMPHQLWSKGQVYVVDFQGTGLKITVVSVEIVDLGKSDPISLVRFGVILPGTTSVSFETNKKDQMLNLVKSKSQSRSNILRPSFKFSDMGIGGLDDEFGQIFRRAFASRTFPPEVVEKLGISHVRGMLLHGPPGTGKTLIARQIGKMLNGREPKVVNGPEILNKFVGQSEENIRKLFEDAETDYAQNKEHADLHIIIFDEIDAICKQRGSTGGGTGVHDTVVNQLLSKIDGVNSLNNILVIGMTNRKDMIDEALLRPGRLEVHVEIGLPDENGRHDILLIHTKAMRESGCLHSDVNIRSLAQQSKNFSGAELAGLIKSAVSFALYGNIDIKAGDKVAVKSVSDILVRMEHFEQALLEIIPAFGVSGEDLKLCLRNGFIDYGSAFRRFMDKCLMFVRHIKESDDTQLVSVLLHGPPGCGKTAIAAQLAVRSDVPFVKLVAPNDYLGMSESEKVAKLMKVFNDAYKSSASIIILDSIERLLEYTPVGPRFSNAVLQALLVKLTHPPPNAKRRLMIIGTTNNYSAIQSMEFGKVFKAIYEVPQVQNADEVKLIIADIGAGVDGSQMDAITSCVRYPIGIQQLLMVLQLAIRFGDGQLTPENFAASLQNFSLDSSSKIPDLHEDYDFKL